MSSISENKNKLPLEIISNLLKKLLDSKLSKLESKSKDEMNKIKSLSQNSDVIINEIQNINKKIKPKNKPKKDIVKAYHPLNIKEKKCMKSSKLNTTSIISCKSNDRSPVRKYYSKAKKVKNNNIKNLKLNRSEIFANSFINNKSNTNSKILNFNKRDSRLSKKSRSKKKTRDKTQRPKTPNNILRKKTKDKPKQYINNKNISNTSLSVVKNKTCSNFYNKSCTILPKVKKDKSNMSKLSKEDELDLICTPAHEDDKRLYDLDPKIKRNKSKNITSLLFKNNDDSNNNEDNKEILNLDESLMNDVNNDELIIYFHNNKSTIKISDDDITSTKSFLGDDNDCDILINSEEHNKNNINIINNYNKNNNYTFPEILENYIETIEKFLTIEEILQICLINKECFKLVIHHLISRTEKQLDSIKEQLTQLKNSNLEIFDKNDDINNLTIKPFECNAHSCRAIDLLNGIPIENIFKNNNLNNKDIILVFDLFFIALGHKKEILNFRNDIKAKLDFYKNYFEKNCNKSFGNSIENKLRGKIFDNNTINSLYEYFHENINKITPSHFQKINSDIALFVFIVKNILEHLGIEKEEKGTNKKNITKLYLLYNARISMNSIILQKLNKIDSIISNKK